MKNIYKIGIYGSAVLENDTIIGKAHALGSALSKYNHILITGAGKGLPYQVVSTAKKINKDLEIWGFPPFCTLEKQKEYSSDDLSIYTRTIYIPQDFIFSSSIEVCRNYRNAISTAYCDAGIIISGRWGTLNEFTNLHGMNKVIGVLTQTGGISDELESLTKKIHKPGNAKVIFENEPDILMEKVSGELEMKN